MSNSDKRDNLSTFAYIEKQIVALILKVIHPFFGMIKLLYGDCLKRNNEKYKGTLTAIKMNPYGIQLFIV